MASILEQWIPQANYTLCEGLLHLGSQYLNPELGNNVLMGKLEPVAILGNANLAKSHFKGNVTSRKYLYGHKSYVCESISELPIKEHF